MIVESGGVTIAHSLRHMGIHIKSPGESIASGGDR
jgi:hypothetical protein